MVTVNDRDTVDTGSAQLVRMRCVTTVGDRHGVAATSSGRPPANLAARLVVLTDRGWAMVEPIRSCVAEVEREWAAHLGSQRFKALRDTLHDLSSWLGKLD